MSTLLALLPPLQQADNVPAAKTIRTQAFRMADQLTAFQRTLLGQAGTPTWLALPDPWRPAPGRQEATARVLASVKYELLEPAPTSLGAYHLTPFGELVTGILIVQALTQG